MKSKKKKPQKIRIIYKAVGTPEEQQAVMDKVFDILFTETLKKCYPKKP